MTSPSYKDILVLFEISGLNELPACAGVLAFGKRQNKIGINSNGIGTRVTKGVDMLDKLSFLLSHKEFIEELQKE